MTKNYKFQTASMTALSLLAAGCTQQKQADQRPNIVFFLVDDIGAECFGCMGGVSYDTHTIDALAEQGIFYTNMHAQPLSTPSRVQLMTGLYNDRNYVAFGYMNDTDPQFALMAQDAGYTTGMFGKWQLGRDREMPTRLGWDDWALYQIEVYKEAKEMCNGKATDRYANSILDCRGHYEYSLYGPDDVEKAAFRFLDNQKDSGKPFLLYYTTPLVHTPHTPTPDSDSWDLDYAGRFKADTKNFPDMVAYMNKKVDNLVNRLKANGQWDNTIFIFTTDNGTSTRITSRMADGRLVQGGKGTPAGTGTHVPLIILWGDRLTPHKSDRLVDFTDFFPTFADIMQTFLPKLDNGWEFDGVSLYPELIGKEPLEKEISLMHFNPLWPMVESPLAARAARTKEYKLYWDGRFFNTTEDFYEEHPLNIEECSDEVKAIYAKLKAKIDEVPNFYHDMPGAPRRGNYGTFYDFALPNNPF